MLCRRRYRIHILAKGIAAGANGSSLSISKNTLAANAIVAIQVDSGADASGLAVNANSITGNAAGIINDASAFDATCNWWGSNAGPPSADWPSGDGDTAVGVPLNNGGSGPVVGFQPWLTNSKVSVACDHVTPVVHILSPKPGANYAIGSSVAPNFFCTDGGGSKVATCTGWANYGGSYDPNSASLVMSLPTSLSGTWTFSVVANDNAGNQTVQFVTYSVSP